MKQSPLSDTSMSRIAVTGYACRLPQIDNIDDYWDVLMDGRCVISEIRADRFDTGLFYDPDPAARGRIYTKAAGQIDNVWAFDPGYFNISPREATQMDPQQRLLLMTVWEALNHAGLAADRLDARRTGVFVGASSSDYSNELLLDLSEVDAPFMTGNTLSIISNRISYLLDLKGPSYTVDTACSSSFYAFHQACQAIESGKIDTAIVGGVNLLLSPGPFVGFSRASMLSPNGLCRAFDASADGYVRSEGAVAVILRRQDLARRAGDPVRSIVVGSGINSDGRTVGMALPSSERQQNLLEQLRDQYDIDPNDLAFVEAHGTGTAIGDPVEATAVGQGLATGRDAPLPIGSAKSNIGHLEPASGLVGFVKAQMALERGELPRSLHVETPNPHIDFEALNLDLAREKRVIEPRERPWVAGINSFGFGGANAHVLIRQPTSEEASSLLSEHPTRALPLSAASADSLNAMVRKWHDRIKDAPAEAVDRLANAAVHRQPLLPHRLVVEGGDQDSILEGLSAFLDGESHPRVATGKATRLGGKTAFVFCGNGAQWIGMGRDLYEQDAAFKAHYDEVADHFVRLGDMDLRDFMALESEEDHAAAKESLGSADIAQPYLFAVQTALVAALAAEGLRPDAVAGHSVGEVAAANTAGIITLKDAVQLIHTRSHALNTLRGSGGMAVVSVTPDKLAEAIAATGTSDIGIAGINSPRYLTISGPIDQLKELLGYLRRALRIAGIMLEVEIPYHSPLVEPLRRRMLDDIKSLAPTESDVIFASSTTGQLANGKSLDTDYWWRNTREVVRFEDAIGALCDAGCLTFVEMSPKPTLAGFMREILSAKGHPGKVIRTLEGSSADKASQETRAIVARAFVEGAGPSRDIFFGARAPSPTVVPRYPWDLSDYRVPRSVEATDLWGYNGIHPLLGRVLRKGSTVWIGSLDSRSIPWLADHKVDGGAVFPAAGFVEMALAAGRDALDSSALELSDFEIIRPLALDGAGATETRTTYEPATGAVRIEARPRLVTEDWALHAFGTVRQAPSAARSALQPVPDGAEMDRETLYTMLSEFGLDYGPHFQLATKARVDGTQGWVALDTRTAPDDDFALNPTCLDAAMHGIFPILRDGLEGALPRDRTFLPVRFGNVRLHDETATPSQARVCITRHSPLGLAVDLCLLDSDDVPVASVTGLRLRAVPRSGRRSDDDCFWYQDHVRLRAKDNGVKLPRGWSVPAGRLSALGLTAKSSPEPDSGALVIDAACRRIAWEACKSLADEDGRLDPRSSEIAPDAVPVLKRMLHVLSVDDAATELESGAYTVSEQAAHPVMSDLCATLARVAPERGAELLALTRLETSLTTILTDGLPAEVATAGVDLSAGYRALWKSASQALVDLVESWPKAQRLNILLIGTTPAHVVAAVLGAGRVDRLTLTSVGERDVERMRQTLPDHAALEVISFDEALEPFTCDIIVALDVLGQLDTTEMDRVAGSLAISGMLLALEARPSLAADLLHGRFIGGTDADTDLTTGLEHSFRDIAVQPLAIAEIEADAIVARPRQSAVRADLPVVKPAEERGVLLVLADKRQENLSLAGLIDASLTAANITVQRCIAGQLLPEVTSKTEVIHLAHMSTTAFAEENSADASDRAVERIETLRPLLSGDTVPARIWMVTRGGAAALAHTGARSLSDSAVTGALRVLANEYPDTVFHATDVAADLPTEQVAEELCSLVVSDSSETEVMLSADSAIAPRIAALAVPPATGAPQTASQTRQLNIMHQSALESLRWQNVDRREPDADEVEIEVSATGLNFRDLMWAQGLLPEEALEDGFAGATLGMECSGRIVRAGKNSGLSVGDTVIAFAPSCFSSHVTVKASGAAALPNGTDLLTAAAVPTIFVTAQYGLDTLANLKADETLLVHGGAGGVGLAALQIAKQRGARVFATAGSPAKRRLLEHLGADRVFDSRSLAFADEVLAATGDEGVDVVLNSLAGEAMERSIACLKPFGRFVELGKRDYYANTRVGLRPFRRNLSYFGVDADQLLSQRPDLAERLLREVADGFASEAFTPPPCQVFEADEVIDAFRLMQQSRHIGKILVRPPKVGEIAFVPPKPIYRDGWLIVGGLGGFGLATAAWLVERGVGKLWLTSRSGAARADDVDALERLRATGIDIEVHAVDATDAESMQALMRDIQLSDIPLRGVVHAAMVLDDAFYRELDSTRISAVMAPKITGAAALDELTRGLELDQFILFSSVTTLFGNPGQTPYVAANAALESIATSRRALSLPGIAIGFGPIADRGYLSRDERTRDVLGRRLGGRMLTAQEALDGMDRVLASVPELPSATVAPMRWRSLVSDLALLSRPLFGQIPLSGGAGMAESIEDLRAMLVGLEDAAAIEKIAEMLAEETARILRQPVSDIDINQPLTELGFDSLMAMDLKLAAEEALAITVPLLSIADGMTLSQLAAKVLGQIRDGDGESEELDETGVRLAAVHVSGGAAQVSAEMFDKIVTKADTIDSLRTK